MVAVWRNTEYVAAAVGRNTDAVRWLLDAEMPRPQLVHLVYLVDVKVAIRLCEPRKQLWLALAHGEVRVPRADRDNLHNALRTPVVWRVEEEHIHAALVERLHGVCAARELHVVRREPHMFKIIGSVAVLALRDR